MANYPTQLDEIDQWLVDNFDIIPGACSSTENLRHTTARIIAEALWPKWKESLHIPEICKENGDSFTDETDSKMVELRNNSATTSQRLDEAAETHLNYDEYMRCLDAADECYESRDKDVYCHETSFRWGFEAGADWQKEQDHYACRQCEKAYDNVFFKGEQHAIKMMEKENKKTIELAEDHAMLAGMVKMEEEMKEKALELTVYPDDDGYPCIPEIVLFDFDKNQPTAKEGDKVKVYIFKN